MRHYSDEDLERFATPLSIHLERAAAARDPAPTDWIVSEMESECTVIYDSYLQWTALLQSFIVRRCGEAAHDEALREFGGHAFREFVAPYATLTVRGRVEALAIRLRASGSRFEVEEDAERVRFVLSRWGAARLNLPARARSVDGRRIDHASYGAYAPPIDFVRLGEARPLTGGMADLPCFLATEVLFLETLGIDMLGAPIATIALPDGPDGPVHLDVSKTGAPPPGAYERLGYAAPAAAIGPAAETMLFAADALDRLATPLSVQVREAADRSDWRALARIAAGMDAELVIAKDPLGILINGLLTWIARHLGEPAAVEALAATADYVMSPYLDWVAGVSPVDAIPMWAMVWRAHGSTMWIEEEADRFVFRGRPLGACARMAASRYAPAVKRISASRVRYPTFGSNQAPMCGHLLREPHPVNHYTSRLPVYSAHCTMLHEIFPIDRIGRPLWVEVHPIDDPDGETIHYHYKDPDGWPERFYAQVGREKARPA